MGNAGNVTSPMGVGRKRMEGRRPFSPNTWGITVRHWIFDVSIIIGNHCWRHGGIDLKSKKTKFFFWQTTQTWLIHLIKKKLSN